MFALMLPVLHLLGAPAFPAPTLLSLGGLILYCFLVFVLMTAFGLVSGGCVIFSFVVSVRGGGGGSGDGGGMVCVWQVLVHLGLIAGSIWWNHLLGGARRWAILSGQLASQLVDQADTAAGIAFLTRDWAEMARRSLAALDEDCGLHFTKLENWHNS